MGRVVDVAIAAAVILFCLCFCDASIASQRERYGYSSDAAADKCLSLPRQDYGYSAPEVATCSFAETLEASTADLQRRVTELNVSTAGRLDEQAQSIESLEGDVRGLQRETLLSRFLLTFTPRPDFPELLGTGLICEMYTYSEAAELARIFLRIDNPNPHFVHVPCAPNCPEKFWKIRPNCYRPNDPVLLAVSPIFNCFYDPLLVNETCTRVVHVSGRGYSNNFGPTWAKLTLGETAEEGDTTVEDP